MLLGARQFFISDSYPYDQVAYVYNNGHCATASLFNGYGAFVDTGFIPYRGIDITCDFRLIARAQSNRTAIFGTLQTSVFNSASFCFDEYVGQNDWRIITGSDNSTSAAVRLTNTRIEIFGSERFCLTNESQTYTGNLTNPLSSGAGPIYYGCAYYQGEGGPVWQGEMNLGRFSISDSATGNTILDLIPCRRKTDSAYGFYNAVTKSFVASENNYAFGAEKVDMEAT